MALPLLATGGRIVGSRVIKSATSATRRNAVTQQTDGQIIQSREREITDKRAHKQRMKNSSPKSSYRGRVPDTQNSATPNQQSSFERQITLPSNAGPKIDLTNVRRIRAGSAGIFIFFTAIPFWVPQSQFWMVSIFGLGGESIPVAKYIIPGETIFVTMNFLVMTIGIITMIYAFIIYSSRLVDAFSGFKGLLFCFCTAFYCAPLLNAFPWFVVWILAVTYFQRKEKH